MRIQQVDITEVFFQTKEYTQGTVSYTHLTLPTT